MSKFNIQQAACFYYLKQIQAYHLETGLNLPDVKPYKQLAKVLKKIDALENEFDFDSKAYTELYFKFQSAAEIVASYELDNPALRGKATPLDELFLKIYENGSNINSKLLETLYGHTKLPSTASEINEALREFSDNTNKKSLKHPDNRLNAFFTSMLGFHYHPLKRNNIPYINEDISDTDTKNLRFGAQTHGTGKVNPTFQRYLLANARRAGKSEKPIDYVYINLLKRDQSEQTEKKKNFAKKQLDKFIRESEGKRAGSLEVLNWVKDLKVAVITLPADNAFLLRDFQMKSGSEKVGAKSENLHDLFSELTFSIQNNKNDFFISKQVKELLFGKQFKTADINTVFDGVLGDMFIESVKEITGKEIGRFEDLKDIEVSPKARSAILFHFIKSQMTSHIIETLDPSGFNTSCKDGIDRGAIHTFWYLLNKHHKENRPLTKDEFLRLLDAPAMIVKYRALNHNRNLIWNALTHRMNADPAFAKAHPYIREWLHVNDPEKTHDDEHRHSFIKSNILSVKKDYKLVKGEVKKKAAEIVSRIKPLKP